MKADSTGGRREAAMNPKPDKRPLSPKEATLAREDLNAPEDENLIEGKYLNQMTKNTVSRWRQSLLIRAKRAEMQMLYKVAFEAALKLSRAVSNDFSGLLQTPRYLHLADVIYRRRPKIIYEFGPGVSTVFMAKFASMLGLKPEIVALEQSQFWHDKLAAALPDEVRNMIDLRKTHLAYERIGPYRSIYSTNVTYPREIDLVYVDGPTWSLVEGLRHQPVMADLIVASQSGARIKYAITDKRFALLRATRELIGNKFTSITVSRTWRSCIFEA